MKSATFTDAVPGVNVTVVHNHPRDHVSWTWTIDPYSLNVPQITIAAKREPFEITQQAQGANALKLLSPYSNRGMNAAFSAPASVGDGSMYVYVCHCSVYWQFGARVQRSTLGVFAHTS